jgi:hypothetical protein
MLVPNLLSYGTAYWMVRTKIKCSVRIPKYNLHVLLSCCSHLEYRASVKRFSSFQFLRQSVRLLGQRTSLLQGRYLTRTQNKHRQTDRQTDMLRVRFEPIIPVFEREKICRNATFNWNLFTSFGVKILTRWVPTNCGSLDVSQPYWPSTACYRGRFTLQHAFIRSRSLCKTNI